jgi:hypothetical protein
MDADREFEEAIAELREVFRELRAIAKSLDAGMPEPEPEWAEAELLPDAPAPEPAESQPEEDAPIPLTREVRRLRDAPAWGEKFNRNWPHGKRRRRWRPWRSNH